MADSSDNTGGNTESTGSGNTESTGGQQPAAGGSVLVCSKIHCVWLIYSGTCAIWHLSFPSSCDIWQKFMFTKIKPEYSDILPNPMHFPGPLVCRIRQVPLYF